MRTDNPWKKHSSRVAYQNNWMQIIEDTVTTPTGSDGIYAYLDSKDSVMVAVLNEKNELYLVRTFSYPVQSWNWELPGGGSDGEDPIVASKRELEEETGIIAKTWERLGYTRVCNGFMTEHMSTYLATDIAFDGNRESADEQISHARFFSMQEVETMIENGDINDGQSITGIYFVQKQLQQADILNRGNIKAKQ